MVFKALDFDPGPDHETERTRPAPPCVTQISALHWATHTLVDFQDTKCEQELESEPFVSLNQKCMQNRSIPKRSPRLIQKKKLCTGKPIFGSKKKFTPSLTRLGPLTLERLSQLASMPRASTKIPHFFLIPFYSMFYSFEVTHSMFFSWFQWNFTLFRMWSHHGFASWKPSACKGLRLEKMPSGVHMLLGNVRSQVLRQCLLRMKHRHFQGAW